MLNFQPGPAPDEVLDSVAVSMGLWVLPRAGNVPRQSTASEAFRKVS